MNQPDFGPYEHTAQGPTTNDRAWRCGRAAVASLAVVAVAAVLRRRLLRWGATGDEVKGALPGDQLIPHADVTATRAITIRSSAAAVWPWLAQLGQGRGGFYSYDVLENLVGCGIHSAGRVVPEWQHVHVGDEVKLAPEIPLQVASVEPGRALVLCGGIPIGSAPAPYDFTWAFVLLDGPDTTTRLVVRERYGYARRWAALIVEPAELISFVMSTRMLRGIKDRAERPVVATPGSAVQEGLGLLAAAARQHSL